MSDDLFELFDGDDSRKRSRKHHARSSSHHDDDDFEGVAVSEWWQKLSRNKWLLVGIIVVGILAIAVAVYLVILLLPLLAEFAESEAVQNSTELAKTVKSFASG